MRMIYHSRSSSLMAPGGFAAAEFRSQSFGKVTNQPWFLPENQGNSSMQIHPIGIEIFVVHRILPQCNDPSLGENRKLQCRHNCDALHGLAANIETL